LFTLVKLSIEDSREQSPSQEQQTGALEGLEPQRPSRQQILSLF
jgi:hypothetical protein